MFVGVWSWQPFLKDDVGTLTDAMIFGSCTFIILSFFHGIESKLVQDLEAQYFFKISGSYFNTSNFYEVIAGTIGLLVIDLYSPLYLRTLVAIFSGEISLNFMILNDNSDFLIL